MEESSNTKSGINLYFFILIGQQIFALVSKSFRLNDLLADHWRRLFHHQFAPWKHDCRLMLKRSSNGRIDSISRSVNQRHRRTDSNWLEERHEASWRLDFELRCRRYLLLLICVDKCVFLILRRADLLARDILVDVDHVRLWSRKVLVVLLFEDAAALDALLFQTTRSTKFRLVQAESTARIWLKNCFLIVKKTHFVTDKLTFHNQVLHRVRICGTERSVSACNFLLHLDSSGASFQYAQRLFDRLFQSGRAYHRHF